MIETLQVQGYFEQHPETWASAQELAAALGRPDDWRSIRAICDDQHLQLMREGHDDQSSPIPDVVIPLAAYKLVDGNRLYHLFASMSTADWAEVIESFLEQSLVVRLSEARGYLDLAADALDKMRASLEA